MSEKNVKSMITVSNSDIVNALFVKQKQKLQSKKDELIVIKEQIFKELTSGLVNEVYDSLLTKVSIDEIISHYEILMKLINPNVDFSLAIDEFYIKEGISQAIINKSKSSYIIDNNKCETKYKLEFEKIKLKVLYADSDDEGTITTISINGSSLSIPLQKTYKITGSIDIVDYAKVVNEISEIQSILYNENSLKEKISAEMTIKSLSKIEGLDSIMDDISTTLQLPY